jgi:hypothetical protein
MTDLSFAKTDGHTVKSTVMNAEEATSISLDEA